MVIPRSRSISILSRNWSTFSRSVSVPVYSINRSARVDFPWSMWAMMEKLRMCSMRILPRVGSLRRFAEERIRPGESFLQEHFRIPSQLLQGQPVFEAGAALLARHSGAVDLLLAGAGKVPERPEEGVDVRLDPRPDVDPQAATACQGGQV